MNKNKLLAALSMSLLVTFNTQAQSPAVTNLLKDVSSVASGTEVMMSQVNIPANTRLPKHWHPGEEYVYIVSGSVTLWQEGKPDTLMTAGDAIKIPLKQIHTAITGAEPVSIVVFRVHEQGKPIRINVDEAPQQ
ncbi:cupin domain-containing protein [Pseudoalteromonas pernae]|uniref:cupin domain-containing protein n=1 Tax=Pseudoalteromonas pernae TaxID=3118054 RepID=UPI003241E5B2